MNIKDLFKSKKYLYLVFPFAICLSVIILSVAISMYQSIQNFSKVNATGYSIIDKFDTEELKEFFAEDSSLNKLKKMYYLCKKQWSSEYYIMTNQPVYLNGISFSNEFVDGYGEVDREKLDLSYVKCIQMNASAINGSHMALLQGRAFYEDEYIYNDTVPVIIGYDYNNYLKLNDVFSIDYLGKNVNVKVVGILNKGVCAAKSDSYSLDKYIVLPALEFPDYPINEEEKYFQLKVYLGHTNSFVYSSNSALYVQSELDDICNSVGIKPYILTGVFPINLLGFGFARSTYVLLLSIVFTYILAIAILSYICLRKYRPIASNSYVLGSKHNLLKLIVFMYIETMIWVLIAAAFCVVLKSTILAIFHVDLLVIAILLCIEWLTIPLLSAYKCFKIHLRGCSVKTVISKRRC